MNFQILPIREYKGEDWYNSKLMSCDLEVTILSCGKNLL